MILAEHFIHPDDAAALRQLQQIPVLPKFVDWYMKNGIEELSWVQNTSYCVRLSEKQFPEIYNKLPPICARFGIPVPEFYLDMDPIPNAWTSGTHRIYITVTRGLIKRFRPDEIDAILAHECGHIVCQHTFYQEIANQIYNLASVSGEEGIVGSAIAAVGNLAVLGPLRRACLAWSRKSELSADRAASIVCSQETFIRTMALLAQIPRVTVNKMDLNLWAEQGRAIREYQSKGVVKKALTILSGVEEGTHPAEVIRAYEFKDWVNSEGFRRMNNQLKGATEIKQLPAESETKRKLRELKEMFDSGLIDQVEYERLRKELLKL